MSRLEERDEEEHKKLMKVFKLLFIGIILFFLSIFFSIYWIEKNSKCDIFYITYTFFY